LVLLNGLNHLIIKANLKNKWVHLKNVSEKFFKGRN